MKKGDTYTNIKSNTDYKVYAVDKSGFILIDDVHYDIINKTGFVNNIAAVITINYSDNYDMEYFYSTFKGKSK